MFKSIEGSTVLSNVKVGTEAEISAAYSAMNKAIRRCGPNFITSTYISLANPSISLLSIDI